MDLYSSIFPHIWTPNSQIYNQLIQQIDVQGAPYHLPKIWADLTSCKFCHVHPKGKMQQIQAFTEAMMSADLDDLDTAEHVHGNSIEEKDNLLKVCMILRDWGDG